MHAAWRKRAEETEQKTAQQAEELYKRAFDDGAMDYRVRSFMKIRAIEVEEDGKVVRYRVVMEEEASWPDPAVDSREMTKAECEEFDAALKRAANERCTCGHARLEHLPACIYLSEGCPCESYVGAS